MRSQEGTKLQNPVSPQPAPIGEAKPPQERRTAWIGRSVFIQGNVVSAEDLTIDGRLEGTIEVGDHLLTIGPDAIIQANLKARAIVIHGAVTGNVTATERIEIHETASVEGDITAPRLAVHAGGVLHGRIDTGAAKTNVSPFPMAI